MSHLLDTNICSAHFRRPGGLAHRLWIVVGGFSLCAMANFSTPQASSLKIKRNPSGS